jgi:uncharacterized SAM-binding protein YcdF (DUF218 family)
MRTLRFTVRLLVGLLAGVGLITLLAITTPLVASWARAYAGPLDQPRGDILIVLGAANDDMGGISYSSYWRAREALLAWQTGGFKKIIVSGGAGPGILNFLVAYGVPRDAIEAEWQARSTRENGIEVARMIQGMPGKKVLLTSDFHMYRALGVFRKLGIDVTPMPAPDVLHATQHWQGRFSAFETMCTETAKVVDYRLHGWI